MFGSVANGFTMGAGFGSVATGDTRRILKPSGFRVSGLDEGRSVGAGRLVTGAEILFLFLQLCF